MLVANLAGLLAYVGPGPGLEFVPHFYTLLMWVAVAVGAVLLWPASLLLRHFLRGKTPSEPDRDRASAGGA